MNLFTRNGPYYHLLKYLIFILKNPVYFEHVSVGLVIQHVMRIRHVVMCVISGCAVFFFPINGAIFGKKKVVEDETYVSVSCTYFV